jgi:protein phosphatase
VTKAIGHGGASVAPTVREIDLEPDDALLACTDGLHGVVPDDVIASMLGAPPAQACGELLAAALAHGSRDNVTAVVVRVATERA